MRRPIRSLEDHLMADAGLARYSFKVRRLLELQRCFQAASPMAASARVANFKAGKVVIHAENGAVATRLRQLTPRLMDALRTAAAEVTGIEIRVQPANPNPVAPPGNGQRALGLKAKQGLTSLAEGLAEGSPLKSALQRLVGKGPLR